MRMRRAKLCLYVDASGIVAALSRGHGIVPLGTFPDDAVGHAAFAKLAMLHQDTPAFITVSSFEEDYSVQTLPDVSRRDRSAILQRRLGQLHRNSHYRGASPLPRLEASPPGMQYLIAALTEDRVLAPWIAILDTANSSVAGVYPLPLILLALLRRRGTKAHHTLLVARHADSLRFLFVAGGALRTHRLTPMPASGDDGGGIAREIHRTLAYLEHSGQLPEGAVLDCVLLGMSAGSATPHLPRHPRLRPLDARALTARLGCGPEDVRAVVLALLARHAPAVNLAPAEKLHRYRVQTRRRALRLASTSVVACTFVLVALALHRLDAVANERRALHAEVARETARIERLFPDRIEAKDIARLEAIVREAERARQSVRLPHRAYVSLSHVLDRHRPVVLESMEWQAPQHDVPGGDPGPSPHEVVTLAFSIDDAQPGLDRTESLNSFLVALRQTEGVSRVRLHSASPGLVEQQSDMAGEQRSPYTVEVRMVASR